ncbi:unnamed protein product [Coregonus sp. 'balchen']|nr:unnamed protein product [Coregonus sp. 'balchen']
MDLAFSSSLVPNSTEIVTVLINAAQNITAFDINTTSVVTSSGISSKTSIFTASCLVVLSLLLSS